ncbi:MAG: hypothetical protein ACUVRZ_07020 [Desulfobacca sp.]|uniref:hypothetical protein n=1 Tax=Desulfobacca sp. TaxID=2067990 RepID=UPI00404B4F2D
MYRSVGQRLAVLALAAVFLQSCSTYYPRVAPFRLPQSYANAQRVDGLSSAASVWQNEQEAKNAFGFNVIKAGLLPVQVVFDNQTPRTYQINPSQTFLVNDRQELFPVLDNQSAYDRLQRATATGETLKGVGKGALLGSATGALIGTAIGVVAGRSAGEYAMRGAVAGGAAGAIMGASHGAGDTALARQIADDLHQRTLKNNSILPQEISQGIIFFPAEAGQATQLRLQLKDQDSDKVINLLLPL